MKYNRLKSLLSSKEITITDFCEQIQITRQGLQKSLDNDQLPYNKVMQSCLILGITPNDFFEWETESIPYIAAERIPYNDTTDSRSNEVAFLRQQISMKDKEIDRLLRLMEAQAGLQIKKANA